MVRAHASYMLSRVYALLACMNRIRKLTSAKPATRRQRPMQKFRRLNGDLTGKALIGAMQVSRYRDVGIEPGWTPMPVRNVSSGKYS